MSTEQSSLPPFPPHADYIILGGTHAYDQQIMAWESRCRLAVEALTDLDRNYDHHPKAQQTISEALAAIGKLPARRHGTQADFEHWLSYTHTAHLTQREVAILREAYYRSPGGQRQCRICRREREARRPPRSSKMPPLLPHFQ